MHDQRKISGATKVYARNPGMPAEGEMQIKIRSIVFVAVVLLAAAHVFAHHGNAGYNAKEVTVKGTVTQWLWTNPHTFLKFDVKDDKGNVVFTDEKLVGEITLSEVQEERSRGSYSGDAQVQQGWTVKAK